MWQSESLQVDVGRHGALASAIAAGEKGSSKELADNNRKAIPEFTRTNSKQSFCFVPFRVISWITFRCLTR